MIITRAPLRISFVGGGTDLPDFYARYPGRVLSATINQYVYVVINHTPLVHKVTARWTVAETVNHPSELQHHRTRAALLDLGIDKNIEIGYFAHLPGKTGLGSSSSHAVALLKGLYAYQGKKLSPMGAAEAACRLEIDLLKEPIGKQDQYAAAYGGFNIFEFQKDGTVHVEPIYLDYQKRLGLEEHALLFFTGMTRPAASVLAEQKARIGEKFETLKRMSDSVSRFRECLLEGNYETMGRMLHDGWLMKKTLASNISNPIIDELYECGMRARAWGGKVLGAGGGGCIFFLAPPERHEDIRMELALTAQKHSLLEFEEIPVSFVQSGAEIVTNGYQHLGLA